MKTKQEQLDEAFQAGVDSVERALRDEFAMRAMQGLISHYGDDGDGVAITSYRIADAMIEARK